VAFPSNRRQAQQQRLEEQSLVRVAFRRLDGVVH
jgi:hypothetical protein